MLCKDHRGNQCLRHSGLSTAVRNLLIFTIKPWDHGQLHTKCLDMEALESIFQRIKQSLPRASVCMSASICFLKPPKVMYQQLFLSIECNQWPVPSPSPFYISLPRRSLMVALLFYFSIYCRGDLVYGFKCHRHTFTSDLFISRSVPPCISES